MTSVEIQYFDGCPNWQAAREAVLAVRPDADVRLTLVKDSQEAVALGFRGSPTILIDGRDPWADPSAPIGLACRLFRTQHGLRGLPSPDQLEAALQR